MALKPEEANVNYFDLKKLPILVAENIAYHLHGIDLVNLGMTCKYWYEIANNNNVWRVIALKRFGENAIEKFVDMDFKRAYFKLSRLKMPVEDFWIVHLGDRYIRKIKVRDSFSDYVIHLKTVCWLQLDGKFNKVLPGKYEVIWRMKLVNAYMEDEEKPVIYYKARTCESCDSPGNQLVYEWSVEELERVEKEQANAWFLHNMGQITVDTVTDVYVEITGRNGYWCGGFFWDYVELRPIESKSSYKSQVKFSLKKQAFCGVM